MEQMKLKWFSDLKLNKGICIRGNVLQGKNFLMSKLSDVLRIKI